MPLHATATVHEMIFSERQFMQRFLFTSAVILALAGGGYAIKAAAETSGAAPPAGPSACLPGHPPGPWAAEWGHRPGPGFPPGPFWEHHHDDKFSLFGDTRNKNLSSADVKLIATAILLEHGNHDWTVTNVTAQPDKSIDFSFATAHGDIIASFSVDPASGHIQRIH